MTDEAQYGSADFLRQWGPVDPAEILPNLRSESPKSRSRIGQIVDRSGIEAAMRGHDITCRAFNVGSNDGPRGLGDGPSFAHLIAIRLFSASRSSSSSKLVFQPSRRVEPTQAAQMTVIKAADRIAGQFPPLFGPTA